VLGPNGAGKTTLLRMLATLLRPERGELSIAGHPLPQGARRARGEKELDQIIQRLGGRLDRLKGRTRKRFRESLRKEIGEVESGPRAKQMAWEAAAAALTSAATLLARRFASRVATDEELPAETQR